jgi:hypothetical protein
MIGDTSKTNVIPIKEKVLLPYWNFGLKPSELTENTDTTDQYILGVRPHPSEDKFILNEYMGFFNPSRVGLAKIDGKLKTEELLASVDRGSAYVGGGDLHGLSTASESYLGYKPSVIGVFMDKGRKPDYYYIDDGGSNDDFRQKEAVFLAMLNKNGRYVLLNHVSGLQEDGEFGTTEATHTAAELVNLFSRLYIAQHKDRDETLYSSDNIIFHKNFNTTFDYTFNL